MPATHPSKTRKLSPKHPDSCISQANGFSERPSAPVHIRHVGDLNIRPGCQLTMSRANDSSALGTGSTALCGLVFAMNDIVQSAEADAIRSRIAEPRETRRQSQSVNICCTEPALAEKFDGQQSLRVLLDSMQRHVSPASNASGTLVKQSADFILQVSGGLTDRNL